MAADDEARLRRELAGAAADDHTRTAGLWIELAELLDDQGREAESEACFERAAEVTKAQMQGGEAAPLAEPKAEVGARAAASEPPRKRSRSSGGDDTREPGGSRHSAKQEGPRPFAKREYMSYEQRHEQAYVHTLRLRSAKRDLTIVQRPYSTPGFASTVWDSSIVLAKFLERHPERVRGKVCVELGAGCALPGIVSSWLDARSVTLTDLRDNLELIRTNIDSAIPAHRQRRVNVRELTWGDAPGLAPCELVLGADLMYIPEAAHALALFAYGRNRRAEDEFFNCARAAGFSVEKIGPDELDPQFQCEDVTARGGPGPRPASARAERAQRAQLARLQA
ncbi:putative methyltransferase-domain-containing protein [Pavlovales sp. CCMP2436]|nr:putative methyltransferase-domain-containing protein [Pavlovales sp. CCMP2436]